MAFFGVVLNLSFMFSGSAGVNPAFAIVGLLLVLAWRNAGWYGLDRWVLPLRGRWGVLGRDGHITEFITTGVSEAERAAMGHIPTAAASWACSSATPGRPGP
jgi:hypothetical protein